MPRQSVGFYALNRGEISRKALARVDVDKLRLAAEQQINIQPLALGAGTLRPGTQYLGEIAGDNPARLLEFVYSTTDTALIELTNNLMRVWVNDALVTRVAVGSWIQAFASWTLVPCPTSTVSVAGGILTIKGVTDKNISSAIGTITVASGDFGKEHGLRVVISKGPLNLRIGTTSGADDLFKQASLDEGTHSIAFTPSVGTLYVQFDSREERSHVVQSVDIESAGVVTLPTPWATADLPTIQYDQSADVIFLAQKNHQQYRIERRSTNGWGIVKYKADDGPFPAIAGDESIQISPNAVDGDVSLVANKSVFKSAHVGSLIRLFHNTQSVVDILNAPDSWTNTVRVSGVSTYTSGATTINSTERQIQVDITGTWTGTITLQRTFDPEGLSDWVDYATYTANQTATIVDDKLYNVIVYYRLGFKPLSSATTPGTWFWNGYVWIYTGGSTYATGYASGSATCQITYKGGGGAGVARIVSVTNPTTATAEVLKPFLNTSAANDWRFSQWNGIDGWPSSSVLHEGRLWWAGNSRIWGSVSDNYASFDFEKIGDAAPIQRSLGKGPISEINWLLSLSRLAIGADSGIITARSNSFDEPLTPTVFNLKYSSTQGTAPLRPITIDTKGMFVQRSGRRVYGIVFSTQAFDYKMLDFTRLNLDIGIPGFVDIAVQRQADTHIRLPLGDGKMANLLYDEDDQIECWWRVQTDGVIENVAVLPGSLEDKVYVVVNRTIGGVTKRYLEKFARLDECAGGTTSKLADAHIVYSGATTTTLTGLSHLEGKAVVVWGDGKEVGFNAATPTVIATYTVTGGSITIPTAVSNAVIGLPYTGTFVSAKLAYAAAEGTAINQPKRVGHVGMLLDTTHYQGVRHGSWGEDTGPVGVRSMPLVEDGKVIAQDTIWSTYDQQMVPFDGHWDTDSRIYLEMRAPRPATISGFVIEMQTEG